MKVRIEGEKMIKVADTCMGFSIGEIAFDLEVKNGKVVEAKLIHLTKPCEHKSYKTIEDFTFSTVRETCNKCDSVFTYPWYEDKRESAHQDPVFDENAKVWILNEKSSN